MIKFSRIPDAEWTECDDKLAEHIERTNNMMSIIGLVASPLHRLPLRAKRFRNTGRKHKR